MPGGTECGLCGGFAQVFNGALGPLVGPVQAEGPDSSSFVHRLCALWSPEVYQTEQGTLRHVGKALRRGRLMHCTKCGKRGATVGCRVEKCTATYHVWCAKQAGCHFNEAQFVLSCPEHIPSDGLLHNAAGPAAYLPTSRHTGHGGGRVGPAARYPATTHGAAPPKGLYNPAAHADRGKPAADKRPAGAAAAQRNSKRARVDTAAVSAHVQAARLALAVYNQAGTKQGSYTCEPVTEVQPVELDDETEWAMKEARRLVKDTSRVAPIILAGTGGRAAAMQYARAMHGAAGQDGQSSLQIWEAEAAGFESLGGLPHVVTALREMALVPLMYPQLMRQLGITPPRGLLLHGVPGSGKTAAVRALAGECARAAPRCVALFVRKGADCLGKYVGDAERTLRLLFQEASRYAPSIIFLDEIDALAPNRATREHTADQVHASVVSTLLSLMDGLHDRGQVLVLAATNRPDTLDPALRRPGRFDREVQFNLPGADARADILTRLTRDWPQDSQPGPVLLQQLANVTDGYAGADLQALCCGAVLAAAQRTAPCGLCDALTPPAPSPVVTPSTVATEHPADHQAADQAANGKEQQETVLHDGDVGPAAQGDVHMANDAVQSHALAAADCSAQAGDAGVEQDSPAAVIVPTSSAQAAMAGQITTDVQHAGPLPPGGVSRNTPLTQQQQQQTHTSQAGGFPSMFASVMNDLDVCFRPTQRTPGRQTPHQRAQAAGQQPARDEGAQAAVSTGMQPAEATQQVLEGREQQAAQVLWPEAERGRSPNQPASTTAPVPQPEVVVGAARVQEQGSPVEGHTAAGQSIAPGKDAPQTADHAVAQQLGATVVAAAAGSLAVQDTAEGYERTAQQDTQAGCGPAAQQPGSWVADVHVREQDWSVALSSAAPPASQREPQAMMHAGRRPLPHAVAPLLLPTLLTVLQQLTHSVPQLLPPHMQQCLQAARQHLAAGRQHSTAEHSSDAGRQPSQWDQVEQELTALGLIEPGLSTQLPADPTPALDAIQSNGAADAASSLQGQAIPVSKKQQQQQQQRQHLPGHHSVQQPPARMLLCGGHTDELQAVAAAALCAFPSNTQVVSLSLPSLVLQGEGDPISGCHRAMAEASRLQAADVPLVLYMPALESWAVAGVTKLGDNVSGDVDQDDSSSERGEDDDDDDMHAAQAGVVDCEVTPMWPVVTQCLKQAMCHARGPVVLLATCSLPTTIIPAQLLSSFTLAETQPKQQPDALHAGTSSSNRTPAGACQDYMECNQCNQDQAALGHQAVQAGRMAGVGVGAGAGAGADVGVGVGGASIQVWQAPGAGQLQEYLVRMVHSMVGMHLGPLLLQSIQAQLNRSTAAASLANSDRACTAPQLPSGLPPASTAKTAIDGVSSLQAATAAQLQQQQQLADRATVSMPGADVGAERSFTRYQPLSAAEQAHAAKLATQVQVFIQASSQRLLKDLRMTLLLRYAARMHHANKRPARRHLHLMHQQGAQATGTETSAWELDAARADDSCELQQEGKAREARSQQEEGQHWKDSALFQHLTAACEGKVTSLDAWMEPLRRSLGLLQQQALQAQQRKQQPAPSCIAGTNKYCWQAAAAAAVLDELEAASAALMQALGLLNPAVSTLLTVYQQHRQQNHSYGHELQQPLSCHGHGATHPTGVVVPGTVHQRQLLGDQITSLPHGGGVKHQAAVGSKLEPGAMDYPMPEVDMHAFSAQLEQLLLTALTHRLQAYFSSLATSSSPQVGVGHGPSGDAKADSSAHSSMTAAVQHEAQLLLQQVTSCWACYHGCCTVTGPASGPPPSGSVAAFGHQPAAVQDWVAELLRHTATHIGCAAEYARRPLVMTHDQSS